MLAICQCIIEMQRRLHKAASVAANALYAPQTASRSVAKSTPWPPLHNFKMLKNRCDRRRFFARCVSLTRLPAGARRAGPPPRNCLRRIASVGPDSRGSAPKVRFLSVLQGRIAKVAALSGLTDGWRRVFRGAGSRAPCGRRRYGFRKASDFLSAICNQPGVGSRASRQSTNPLAHCRKKAVILECLRCVASGRDSGKGDHRRGQTGLAEGADGSPEGAPPASNRLRHAEISTAMPAKLAKVMSRKVRCISSATM